ncbi:MAG: hypothetical protein GY928_05950 [Colwellia sp.]|nr:hypothetical protein [Colwellia sp.]
MESIMRTEHNVISSTNKLTALIDILIEPKKALLSIKNNPNWFALPLMILLVSFMGLLYWYYSTIDAAWFIEYQLSLQGEITNEQAESMRKYLNPLSLRSSSLLFSSIAIIITYALYAAYLNLMSKLSGADDLTFSSWFSFSIWTAFPSAIATLSMIITYGFTSSYQVDINNLSVLSLNNLFFHFAGGESWFTFLNSLNVTTFWSLGLTGFGYSLWTKKSITHGQIVAFAPYILIYSLWAIYLY